VAIGSRNGAAECSGCGGKAAERLPREIYCWAESKASDTDAAPCISVENTSPDPAALSLAANIAAARCRNWRRAENLWPRWCLQVGVAGRIDADAAHPLEFVLALTYVA